MSAEALPLRHAFLGGKPHTAERTFEVRDKYLGTPIAEVPSCSAEDFARAIDRATQAHALGPIPPYRRSEVLRHVAERISERAEDLADLLCAEVGKPLRDARAEVSRAAETFKIASEEALRIGGEVLELERLPRLEGYFGLWKRFPAGPIGAITPFNFPLNLVAHKVAPAVAAGCPFILKPASYTPLSALAIGEMLAETDMPPGSFSVLPASPEAVEPLLVDSRVRVLSFTGSSEVGWSLQRRAVAKRVLLELGGNAGCVIDETADLDWALERVTFGGFYQAGQSCISVQRVMVAQAVYDDFKERLVERVRALPTGDPRDEKTFVGPLISEADAQRVESWIQAAVERGARLLCGGRRHGAIVEPTVLENAPRDADVYCKEVFGPVVTLESFERFEAALESVNDSRYGLQAGIFTTDLRRALEAYEKLEVGGVIVGDVPSFRADHMPYGGAKASGIGREGVRFAIEEMTEPRMLVVRK